MKDYHKAMPDDPNKPTTFANVSKKFAQAYRSKITKQKNQTAPKKGKP